MFHFAGVKNPVIDEALHDNLVLSVLAGVDLSPVTFFDKLDINAGWVSGFDRARADMTGWFVQPGFLSETRIEYRHIGSSILFIKERGRCII
jgi:hypothetical protein